MTLFYPVTNERFLALADLLQTGLDSDDFTFDYTNTSDKAVSMDVWTKTTYLHL